MLYKKNPCTVPALPPTAIVQALPSHTRCSVACLGRWSKFKVIHCYAAWSIRDPFSTPPFIVCVYLHMPVNYTECNAHGSQKRSPDAQGLELQVVVSHVGTRNQTWASTSVAGALNHWALSPALKESIFKNLIFFFNF